MTRIKWSSPMPFALLAVVALALSPATLVSSASNTRPPTEHVLLISVDGLHQSDLDWYVQRHPDSALASLVKSGVEFTNAQTPVPSDSFPGMVAQVTGVVPLALDAGQGLAGLPWSILNMTGTPQDLIDITQLPVDPKTCKPVFPHQYLLVNTVFEVARTANLRTAWSDKHPAYEILDGPSGTGIQDLFTPEINSNASAAGNDYTKDNGLTQIYDSFKVEAVLNEIKGFDHSGKKSVGEPAIFGMNFQTVSTAQKLPSGGYMADGVTPNALLAGALHYINSKVGLMVSPLDLKNSVASYRRSTGSRPTIRPS